MRKQELEKVLNDIIANKKVEDFIKLSETNYSNIIKILQERKVEFYTEEDMQKQDDLFNKYTNKGLQCEKTDKTKAIGYYEKAIELGVSTPYPYDKVIRHYLSNKEYNKANRVCDLWFDSYRWFIPNCAKGTAKLYKLYLKVISKI